MTKFEKAICFATQVHSGAHRKGTAIPYIVHPMEAAAIAATITTDEDVLCAAVLHDTIEDTPTTYEDIVKHFGDRVAVLVGADSEDKMEHLPASETWELRKQATIDHVKSSTREEQIIVLADKLSNIRAIARDYERIGDDLWLRFNQKDKAKQAWYYSAFIEVLSSLSDTAAYREYKALVTSVFAPSNHQ